MSNHTPKQRCIEADASAAYCVRQAARSSHSPRKAAVVLSVWKWPRSETRTRRDLEDLWFVILIAAHNSMLRISAIREESGSFVQCRCRSKPSVRAWPVQSWRHRWYSWAALVTLCPH